MWLQLGYGFRSVFCSVFVVCGGVVDCVLKCFVCALCVLVLTLYFIVCTSNTSNTSNTL